MDDIPPELGNLKNICLVDGNYLFVALSGSFERKAGNTFNFIALIDHGVPAFVLVESSRLAEINTAGEFTEDKEISTLNHVGLEGGGSEQGVVDFCRSEVCKKAKLFADFEQCGFRFVFMGQRFPFWAADGTKQNSITLFAGFERGRSKHFTVQVIRSTTEGMLLNLYCKAVFSGELIQYCNSSGNYFGADSISRY